MPNKSILREKLTSPEVKGFIEKYLHSVAHLNVLLLLYKNPHQDFGAKMLDEHLHLGSDTILMVLSDLETNKMASKKGEKEPCFWYLPGEDKNMIIALLNEAFSKIRIDLLNLILKKV
jgi:hypothetical protein